MKKRNIIVICASTGGFDAIKKLVAGLPPNMDAAIFIVWHISPDIEGIMPEVLNKQRKLVAAHVQDREPIQTGRIYIAPPDHHMLLENGLVRVTRGPKENMFRPSMPLNALKAVHADHKVTAAEMGSLLAKLIDNHTSVVPQKEKKDSRTEMEINIALEEAPLKNNILEFGKPTPYTCPECHGTLAAIKEGDRVRSAAIQDMHFLPIHYWHQ